MNWPRWMLVVYALINIAMGIQSYFFRINPEPGSSPHFMSIVAGVAAGLILLFCVWLTFRNPRAGFITATVVCLLLAFQFGSGLLKQLSGQADLKIYPTVIAFALAAGTACALAFAHFHARHKAKQAQTEG